MVTTEVSSQSWFGRIGESIKSFLIGIVFFIGSFPLLFLNEGRAVRTDKGLHEGAGAVVSVASDHVDPANNQKLVHLTGKATSTEALTDPDFLVASANTIKLRRHVEMYQWEEKSESTTEKKVGGGSETKTTYTYDKKWSDKAIDSSGFKEPDDHKNSGALPFESRDAQAEHVTLGAFTLTPSLIAEMDDFVPVPVTDQSLAQLPAALKSSLKVHDGSFYQGADPANPAIGDARIVFTAVMPADVSVISKQTGTSFEPYKTTNGMDIEMLKPGIQTSKAMFDTALKQNSVLTWVLRAVGFFVMFLGLVLFFRPISVLGDIIPFVGSMMAFGTGLFAFVMAAGLTLATIAVAWIVYRPILGIGLFVAAFAVMAWLLMRGKKKVAATAVSQPVPASR